MVSSRSGLVDSSATWAPISSSIRRTYFTALPGRSFQLRAPWVVSVHPYSSSYTGTAAAWSFRPEGR